MLGKGPHGLGKGPHGLGNGLHGLGNGPHLLGIMSRFGIMSHSVLCRIRGYVVQYYVFRHNVAKQGYDVRHNVAFGIMLHSDLCRLGLCCSA